MITLDTYGKIKELCDERGINIAALAQGTGIRSSVFTELKKGRTKQLSAPTLEKLAAFFEVPVSVFFGDDEAGPETLQNELFRKRKLLFDLSAKATEEELDRIIKIVDALVDGN
ncbi:MAG: helix-turn-helix transcriptional regulator [Clostridia bacterium]|nr:helix-turn-helix transcriptional regulator [Clostridia bacterium]